MKFEADEGIPNRDAAGPRETILSAQLRNKRSYKTFIGYSDETEVQMSGAVRVFAVGGRKITGEPARLV